MEKFIIDREYNFCRHRIPIADTNLGVSHREKWDFLKIISEK